MGSIGPDEVYLLGRSPDEAGRLNKQHEFLVDLIGGLPIHPSIPTKNIHSVADVATGTGIWLSSVTDALHPTPTNRLYLHGFDISPVQYPFTKDRSPTHETHLSVHDVRDRFPPEHRNRYDLVHLRLLVGALKEVDYPAAVRNVIELLKPGGYLQWDECDCTAFNTAEQPPSQIAQEMQRIVLSAVHNLGLPLSPPGLIESLARDTGLEDVSRRTYNTLDKPHLHATASAWILRVMQPLLPNSIVSGTGDDPVERERALERANGLLKEFEGHVGRVLPLVNLQVIVGRKASLPTSSL